MTIQIPPFESDSKTPLLGSCFSKEFTVEYYLRCFIKIKTLFEHGQGECIQFPIFIINKEPTVEATINPAPTDIVGQIATYNEEVSGHRSTFAYPRNSQWTQPHGEASFIDQFHTVSDYTNNVAKELWIEKWVMSEAQIPEDHSKIIPVGINTSGALGFNWPSMKGCD